MLPEDDDDCLWQDYQRESILIDAKRAAARAIVPGCEHWDVKSPAWPRGLMKPDAAALEYEIMRRDANRRPKGWSLLKKCEWLFKNAPSESQSTQGEGPTQAAPPPRPPRAKEPEVNTSQRWSVSLHGPRLWHAISIDKDGFLRRDERPENRCSLQLWST